MWFVMVRPPRSDEDWQRWHYCSEHEELAQVGQANVREVLRTHRLDCRRRIRLVRMTQGVEE